MYFKKLVHTNVVAGKSDIHRVGLKARGSDRIDGMFLGENSFFFPETLGFALMAFNRLGVAHPHCGR